MASEALGLARVGPNYDSDTRSGNGVERSRWTQTTFAKVQTRIVRVARRHGMPGGGYEMQFLYNIPPQYITVIRP